jgi:hypothetical protein
VALNENILEGVLSKKVGQPLQVPEVAHTKNYLKEAGVASQEAGQPLQCSEVVPNETYT